MTCSDRDMIKIGGKSRHAPNMMSQNGPESRNGFITIRFHFINIPNANMTM